MTKDQRTIKAQAVQITDLANEVAKLKSDLEVTRDYKECYANELADINATFDLLGVPRNVKSSYHELSVNSRLTLFLAQLSDIKVEQPKEDN